MALPTPTELHVSSSDAATATLTWTPFKNDGSATTVLVNDTWADAGYSVGDDYPCMLKGAAYTNHWRRSYQSDSVDGSSSTSDPATEPPWRTRPVFSDDYAGRLSTRCLKIEFEHGDAGMGWRTRRKEMILQNGDTGYLPQTGVFRLVPGKTYAWSYSILLVDNGDFDQFGSDGSVMLQTHTSSDGNGELPVSPVVMFGVQSNKYPVWYGYYATKAMHGAAGEDLSFIGDFNGANEEPPQEIADIGVGWTYGRYVDVVTIIKPDPIGAGGPWPADGIAPYTGSYEVWTNGVKVVDYTGPMNTNDQDHNYGPIIGNYFTNHSGVLDADHGQPHINYIGHFMLAEGDGVTFADVAPNGDITGYAMQQRVAGEEWADVPAGNLSTPMVASAETVTVSGLSGGNNYQFRIKALSSPDVANDESTWSETSTMADIELSDEQHVLDAWDATISCVSSSSAGSLYYCAQTTPLPTINTEQYIIDNSDGVITPVTAGKNEAVISDNAPSTTVYVGWVQMIPGAPYEGDFYTSPGPFTFIRGGEQTGEAIV